MPDPFSQLIPDARAFLSDLADTNTRVWFSDHKSRYDDHLKTPALLLLDHMAQDLAQGLGRADGDLSLTPKLFRAHRDVRFSKDKTPYHTHLHMMWSLGPAGPTSPALFFGISPSYTRLGAGVMGFGKDGLTRWRATLNGPDGDAIQQELHLLSGHGYAPAPPDLKRVPAPFGRDHPHADLLRCKGIAVWRDLPAADHAEPIAALRQAFERLRPLLKRLQLIV